MFRVFLEFTPKCANKRAKLCTSTSVRYLCYGDFRTEGTCEPSFKSLKPKSAQNGERIPHFPPIFWHATIELSLRIMIYFLFPLYRQVYICSVHFSPSFALDAKCKVGASVLEQSVLTLGFPLLQIMRSWNINKAGIWKKTMLFIKLIYFHTAFIVI